MNTHALLPAVAGLLVLLLWLFARAAERGTGWASRIVQFLYYRVGSLESYHKTGRTYGSAMEIVASAGEPRMSWLVRRVAPSQLGWFSTGYPTDKGAYHDYLAIYDRLLAPYRQVRGLRVLEVGVKKGGSLALWREFFDETAFIYGIDVNPDVPTFRRDGHIKVLVLDSRDEATVRAALGTLEFDIIIDDGLHLPEAQRRTFDVLAPFLTARGVYVIEDVYAIDVDSYRRHGLEATVFPDQSGQQLVVLASVGSLADVGFHQPAGSA